MARTIASLLIIVCVSSLLSCSESYFPEPETKGGWRKNFDPDFIRDLGLDPKGVRQFGAYNLRVDGTTSAIVIKDGWVIGEWYHHLGEESKKVYVASVGKSFTISCFGIVVKDSMEGRLPFSITRHSKLYDKRWLKSGFPLSDPRKQNITFERVLRHTAGFGPETLASENGRDRWKNYESWVVGHDPEWVQTQNLYYPPGNPKAYKDHERWGVHEGTYSSIGFAHIGLVLQRLYAQPAHDFLWTRLLKPIGFSDIGYYHPPNPPSIMWFTGGGLEIKPLDLARFAYLTLHKGAWDGEQILPEEWIDSFITTPYYQNLRSNVDGYLGKRYPPDMYRMYGSGGNFVFVIPSLDMIVIRTGRMHNFFLERLEHDFLRRAFNMIPAYRTE